MCGVNVVKRDARRTITNVTRDRRNECLGHSVKKKSTWNTNMIGNIIWRQYLKK